MPDHWVVGDQFGLPIPADPVTLRDGGAAFLTDAFRAFGVLGDADAVSRIVGFEEFPGGSTGRKVALDVEYCGHTTSLSTELFVKFSRDLDSPLRDVGKSQMQPEVRFAVLTRTPGFPIAVPTAQFADYHRGTGTGILITERIPFGTNGIERQYRKCLDYEMPDALAHYRALLTALARLAGAHRAGGLPADLLAHFPVDVRAATVGQRAPMPADTVRRRVDQVAELAQDHPGLLPSEVGAPNFIARLREEVPRVVRHADALLHGLAADDDYVALCHWNANVDNAWFWRDAGGQLRCGLLDWGCVGQMNMGMAIWGAMSAAETDLWTTHLDDLLGLFVAEVHRCGGPGLDPGRLRRHTLLYAAAMGTAWLLDVPALLRNRFDPMPRSRTDPRIRAHEGVRAPLQMLSNLLCAWERYDVGDLLDAALAERAWR